jgi:hypothetical protein
MEASHTLLLVCVIIISYSSFKKGKEIRELKDEAIKRGYAEMVLESPTSDSVIFKWKD